MARPRPALAAALALALWGLGTGAGRTADDSGMRQFQMDEALRRQGINPNPRPVQRERSPAAGTSTALSSPTIGQRRTYCVRTCDGYYFSIGFARNRTDLAAHEAMCASSCGDAPMKLYSAPINGDASNTGRLEPAIERAADDSGALYTALPTAYAFKNQDTATCACKSTASGLPQIPMTIDPTLRDGDIIVTQDGLKVFHGTSAAPHQPDDFVGIASAKALPSVVRDEMLSLQGRIAE
jgi:hypothetical protein